MEFRTMDDVFRKDEIDELLKRMETLRRDPDIVGGGIIDPTPNDIELDRLIAEYANYMLDDCITIVKDHFGMEE